MKVQVRDGVFDLEPYKDTGEIFEFSGFTGKCTKKEYESAVEEDDVVLITFDAKSLKRFPQEYIDHADELDEDYTRYGFYKKDLIFEEK